MSFFGVWPCGEKEAFIKDLRVIEDFISESEEKSFMDELEPYLKRMHYEYDHWDDVTSML